MKDFFSLLFLAIGIQSLGAQTVTPYTNIKTSSNMPIARAYHAMARYTLCNQTDNQIYVFGGYEGSFSSPITSLCFHINYKTWSQISPLPQNKSQFQAASIKDGIYLSGGRNPSFAPSPITYKYNPANDSYDVKANMPTPVFDYALATYKDSLIYYLGGNNGTNNVNLIQIYDPALDTWTVSTSTIPGNKLKSSAAAITGNTIILVGGQTDQDVNMQYHLVPYVLKGTINIQDPTEITWTSVDSYPEGQIFEVSSGAAPLDDGRVYFAGGIKNEATNELSNKVYAYNTITDEWEVGPNLPYSFTASKNMVPFADNDSLKFFMTGGVKMVVNNNINTPEFTKSSTIFNVRKLEDFKITTPSDTFCGPRNIILTAQGTNNYNWSPAYLFNMPNENNQGIYLSESISITLTSNNVWGCTVQDVVDFTFLEATLLNIDLVADMCVNAPDIIINATPAGGTFVGPGIDNNGNFSPSIAGPGFHIIKYAYVAPNGCVDSIATGFTVNACLGYDSESNDNIKIFPNPSDNFITIQGIENSKIEILNAAGQSLISANSTYNEITLDVSTLSTGLYFIAVESDSLRNTFKFIKN